MKISEILKNKRLIFSCEFYPPKTPEGMDQLFNVVHDLKELSPGYISVTYGAGGGTRDKTIDIVSRIKHEIGIESMAHLTCVGHSRSELKEILDAIRDKGIENVIALRGDPPAGEKNFVPHRDGFRYGYELAQFIKSRYDFCIAVAGYPEGHIEAPNRETDWNRLLNKVSCGASFIVTQLFFDNRDYFEFEKWMRDHGVTVPIIPGIMPVTNYHQILKFTRMCGAKIPSGLLEKLESVKEDAEAVCACGIEHATRQCEELIARGVPGIHFYTLNKSRSTRAIIENLRKYLSGRKDAETA